MNRHHDFSNEPETTDAHLAEPAQMAMREVVRALPEDSLSLSWRSGLNERLVAEAARSRKRARFFWALRPAAGLAFAGALAAMFVVRMGSAPLDSTPTAGGRPSFEAELLSAHTEVATYADVAGTGVRPIEAAYATRGQSSADLDWSEVDIESL
ncbi:MAG: hypothetical protein ACO1SV_16815 [Fimbriimonas sp.]